ncbi:hypothetical protein NDU88_004000 [Pleurodeles waltl]|uniref:Flavin-containing monooxygenase n=2 Tax=Pleurodeles waltl TaxID=8319 RepID=A0AAV7T6B2_PLEWA|nr:hypothetical protein NDU88_004000 [Pleurodeles waltl]
MVKTVAVIGAGISGLAALKCCLEVDLDATCFEGSDDLGGLWNFKEEVVEGRASIYRTVFTNACREMMSYPDFPIPEDYPNYLHNSLFLKYLHLYAQHFNLQRHIKFKTMVVSVRKRPDYSVSGQWEVVTEKDGKQESLVFDTVMVCTGHHVYPNIPAFPGIEKFKGQHFHNRNYKSPEGYQGKKVLVVGLGNTGADIATELSNTAEQVYLSTRSGSWIMTRVWDGGYPWDMVYLTRYETFLKYILPRWLSDRIYERMMNKRFDHGKFGLTPKDKFSRKEPVFNDSLATCIACGTVKVKPNVKEFTETSVIFEDGTVQENVDFVIFSTGYSYAYPFLDESDVRDSRNQVSLYKDIFPPNLEKPTMAIIGLVMSLGGIPATADVQARWAARVFKGSCKLPPRSVMVADNEEKVGKKKTWFGLSDTLQTDYIVYMDEVSSFFGAKVNLLYLFLTDPRLAWEVFFGPASPYQFRLTGPGKWDGARKAILGQWERTDRATRTRAVPKSNNMKIFQLLQVLFLPFLVAAVFLLWE